MPLCPSCQKVKLIRCKILRTEDPDYGREYVACSACSSRWFLDDPNRPPGLVSDKPKQSIWKKLGTWGAPHNVPDSSGVLRAATYVLPPVHEYPSLLVPVSNSNRRSLLIPPAAPDPSPVSPAAGPSELDLPPPPPPREPELDPLPPADTVDIPERTFDDPAEAADQTELPVEDAPQSQEGDEPQQAEEPTPAPEEPLEQLSPAATATEEPKPISAPGTPHQTEEQKTSPASNLNSEEQARFEMLYRIASSPGPHSQISDHHLEEDLKLPSRPQSTRGSEHQPSLPPITPSEPISPEEQQLRETLLRVVSTPCPPPPKVYTTLLSPNVNREEATCSYSPQDEREVAAYIQHSATRLDQAIQNSPFTPKETPRSQRTERWIESPRFSEPKSPASKHSAVRSSRHSTSQPRSPRQPLAQSSHGTPRSTKLSEHAGARSVSHTPRRSHYDEEEVPLPGGFPTPKPMPLTSDDVSRLRSQPVTPYSTSLKSSAPSGPLPIAPSHYTGSVASGRTPKRVSIASCDNSPLFS
ncbi:hypothetical protein PGT21_002539 [Puccinia graminis f. sp. tritici]|uniref:Uncharacterized protein n=1 Tax=Puccinia graminis f. sp. tritici TaxID=56615 RepID=A0A5B0Q9F8_PUCGR|nr:hypothetical protein PGT21_002539 [Puccinia graminis f. sp. tritici]